MKNRILSENTPRRIPISSIPDILFGSFIDNRALRSQWIVSITTF